MGNGWVWGGGLSEIPCSWCSGTRGRVGRGLSERRWSRDCESDWVCGGGYRRVGVGVGIKGFLWVGVRTETGDRFAGGLWIVFEMVGLPFGDNLRFGVGSMSGFHWIGVGVGALQL